MAQVTVDQDELRKMVREEVALALKDLMGPLRQGPAAAAGAAPAGTQRIEPRVVAVLAAAAMAALRHPVRLKRITFLNQNTISGWAEMGRMAIQTSHNIHRAY